VAALTAVAAVVVTPAHAARTFDLSTASIVDINAAFDAGALTSEKLTALYLARIAAYDKAGPRLNSIFHSIHGPSRTRALSTPSAAYQERGLRFTGFRCCSKPTSM
jgi:Asp-tRNA(Asn)/Glu-tRNA(Gln) amidotransferase A subunit family amidase